MRAVHANARYLQSTMQTLGIVHARMAFNVRAATLGEDGGIARAKDQPMNTRRKTEPKTMHTKRQQRRLPSTSIHIGGGLSIALPQIAAQPMSLSSERPASGQKLSRATTSTLANTDRAVVHPTPYATDTALVPRDDGSRSVVVEEKDAANLVTDVTALLRECCRGDRDQGTSSWLPSTDDIAAVREVLHAARVDRKVVTGEAVEKVRWLLTEVASGIVELERRCMRDHRNYTRACTPSDIAFMWSIAAGPSSHALVNGRNWSEFAQQLSKRTDRLLCSAEPPLQAGLLMLVARSRVAPDALIARMATELSASIRGCREKFATRVAMGLVKPGEIESLGNHEHTEALSSPVAVALAAIIGEESGILRGHFQLHQLFHDLVPQIERFFSEQAARPNPSVAPTLLRGVIQGMAKYSVGGEVLLEKITRVVRASLGDLAPNDILLLLKSLRTIGRPSMHRPPVGQQTDRRATTQRRARQPMAFQRPLDGVESDYMPLVQVLMCEGVVPLLPPTSHSTSEEDSAQIFSAASDSVYKSFLVELYGVHCQLEYPSWGDVYCRLADAIAAPAVASKALAASTRALNGGSCDQPPGTKEGSLSLPHLSNDDVSKMVAAILHRNTAVPFHPLHALLVERLTSHAAIISKVPTTSSSSQVSRPSREEAAAGRIRSLSCIAHFSMCPSDSRGHPSSRFMLEILSCKLGDLTPVGFSSALCVAPLADLPIAVQQSLVQHFTTIASSLGPAWLARGVSALLDKISSSVDAMSLHAWLSKLSAAGVADDKFLKSMDVLDASTLLRLISTRVMGAGEPSAGDASNVGFVRDADASTVALAKQALLARITRQCALLDVADMPVVIGALCDADLFLPIAFSRICRALLPHVEGGALGAVLSAFEKLAVLFTTRRYAGTLFEDVWEMLRARCIREAHSLTLHEATLALSAFGQLDVCDQAVLHVLTLRVWELSKTTTPPAVASNNNNTDHQTDDPQKTTLWDTWTSLSEEAQTIVVYHIAMGMLPLDSRLNTGEPTDEKPHGVRSLEALLHSVESKIDLMYPQTVVQLSTAVYFLATSIGDATTMLDLAPLLHRTMDRCRDLLLLMYRTPKEDPSSGWTPRAKRSTVLPPQRFVELLVAMAASGTMDTELFVTILQRVPRRWLRSSRGIDSHQLVLLALASCAELSDPVWLAAPAPQSNPAVVGTGNDAPVGGSTEATNKQTRRALLAPILDSVVSRMEELLPEDAVALQRCLEHYFGADRIDSVLTASISRHLSELRDRGRAAAVSSATTTAPVASLDVAESSNTGSTGYNDESSEQGVDGATPPSSREENGDAVTYFF